MSFGFGNNNSGGGFGSSTGFGSGTGFGANNNTSTGGSLFGGNTATAGGFAFGANNSTANNSPFGANKPATGFGASTTGGNSLFGGNTAASGGTFGGGGMFGANNNNNNGASTGFGGNTGGGLFGGKAATTGFGASTATTGGSLFGGNNSGSFGSTNNATSNPFSANNNATASTTSAFGAPANSGTGFGGFGATSTASSNNGTASVPFQAFTEKDGPTNTTSSYQSISFQDPYKTKSFEELRVEDYLQGRRYGNSNGQAGGFGQSTGFGGFGGTTNAAANTGSSLFGANNSSTPNPANSTFGGFGASTNNNATSAFGNNNAGSSLFGANKPAGGSLFGASTTTPAPGGFGTNTTTNPSTSLFGGANNTATNTGFGANNATGGSLFGNTATTGQTNAFGSNNATGSSLFGNNAAQNKPATSLFGGTTNPNAGGSLFGSTGQQQTGSSLFGNNSNTNAGNSLFGNNNAQQAKPAGFGGFGATGNTGGSTFGANNAAPGTSLFGNTNNQSAAGSSLFGAQNQANKPGGLFGGTTNTANAGGSLFGNTQQQQQGGSSLFGNTANNNAGSSLFGNNQSKSLFGSTTNTNAGGNSLFGNTQQAPNNAGSSLFGGGNQSNGNSLFGNSLQQSQPQNQLHASLTVSPYGNDQLFASLAAPAPPVGPLATPLQGAKPTPKKTQSLLGTTRVNSPVYTPRASTMGRNSGYGISYSTFGTPNSSFSGTLTPGASSLLRPSASVNSALTSRLSKSFSTSNLRQETTAEGTSLLRPSPLTPGSLGTRYGSGSMRKLRIDRSLRQDLFEPSPRESDSRRDSDPRRVNFEDSTESPAEPSDATPSAQNALVTEDQARAQKAADEPKTNLFKTDPRQSAQNGRSSEHTNGVGALSTVPENGLPRAGSAPVADLDSPNTSGEPGEYFTKPSLDQLAKMSRKQLEKIGNFIVGRHGIGTIRFHSCDLTSVALDDICGKIVELIPRNATVYPKDINKPPEGQGLNVPATIILENSWPKAARGKKLVLDVNSKAYKGHIKRLTEVGNTRFKSYNQEDGAWTFEVDHFTTYALDDDDDDDMTEQSSALSDAPATPTGFHEDTMQSIESINGELDDTFHFKHDRKAQQILPGAFDTEVISFLAEPMDAEHEDYSQVSSRAEETPMEDPFVSAGGPVRAPSPRTMTRLTSSGGKFNDQNDLPEEEEDSLESLDVPGAFVPAPAAPRSILKPGTLYQQPKSPARLVTDAWEEQLQRTMSPKKRDRLALKDVQQNFAAQVQDPAFDNPLKQSALGQSLFGQSYLAQKAGKKQTDSPISKGLAKSQAFTTSMDIMNSLWANEKAGVKTHHTKEPQSLQPKRSQHPAQGVSKHNLSDDVKPNFNPSTGILSYSIPGSAKQVFGELVVALDPIVGEHKDIRFAKSAPVPDLNAPSFAILKEATIVSVPTDQPGSIPIAQTRDVTFSQFATQNIENSGSQLESQEACIWKLCSILFDPVRVGCASVASGIPDDQIGEYATRIQSDAFKEFWSGILGDTVQSQLSKARTAEHRALLHLTQDNVSAACDVLSEVKDHRLAILIAQLPGSTVGREAMQAQIKAWRQHKDWSEMSEGVRALYSVLAGDVCLVPGQDGAPEDKANDFCISEKFDLTWKQALALRVSFGGHASLEEAINTYLTDLDDERESVTPTTLWDVDFDGDDFMDKEDTLMTLLRLFSRSGTHLVPTVIDPLTVSGNAMNSRLGWQLAVVLRNRSIGFLSDEAFNRLTLDFSAELESSSDILDAVWVLLHINHEATRQRAILAFLERNGDKIASPNEDGEGSDFLVLTDYLHIPAAQIWAAKATYAATTDAFYNAYWLLKAHQADLNGGYDLAAHEALCATVAPQAVIEEDYDRLNELVQAFQASPQKPEGWDVGAGVYTEFLHLLGMRVSQRSSAAGQQSLRDLKNGLAGMREAATVGKKMTLEQRVAILEMEQFADHVAKDVEGDVFLGRDGGDQIMTEASAYGLPAPTDMFLAYQRAMGVVN